MNKYTLIISISLLFIGLFVYIYINNEPKIANRWYTQKQVDLGGELFRKNCAICHGNNAQKTILWKKTLADGSYPPPPLNDKAHAWHHPKWQLMQIITEGGKPYDGNMPAFGDKLTKKEKEATIAFFQSFWDEKHYSLWIKYGGLKDK